MEILIGTVIINGYQIEDFMSILLNNNYIVKVQNDENKDKKIIEIYTIFTKNESEEN